MHKIRNPQKQSNRKHKVTEHNTLATKDTNHRL